MALVIANSGRLAHQLGDLERGREMTRRGLELATQSLDPMVSAQAALFCGHVALDSGLLQQAQTDFEAALRHSLALENRTMSSAAIEWMIVVAGHEHHDVALIDAFTQVRRNSPGTASPRPEWDRVVAEAREALTDGDYMVYAARGQAMDLEDAIDHARGAATERLRQLN